MTQIVSVTLPSAALYVSGTVNGEATVWTNTDGNTWETVAPRSASDTYLVELTIIDELGLVSYASLTLFYGVLALITDRTEADRRKAQQLNAKGWAAMTDEERQFYLRAENKGTYKALDLNRVNGAVDYLAGKVREAGIAVELLPMIDWQDSDIPTPKQLEDYLSNVAALWATVAQLPSTPLPLEDIGDLTIKGANNIEKILLDLDNALKRLQLSLWYCNENYCGEV